MWITLLILLIIFGCIAAMYTEGMWSNAIRLINVVTAALLATNFWEPAANWIEGMSSNAATYTHLWDFLLLWGLFALFMSLLRVATDFLSRVKVRFLSIVDRIGGIFFAAWVGWVMACFTAMSLHMAPVQRDSFLGGFQPEQRAESSLAPEMKWLAFMQKQSRGAFSRWPSEQDLRKYPAWKEDQARTFDPQSEFLPKYATRRANLEAYNTQHGTIRLQPKDLPR